jgi:hypothetical protein
VSPSNKHGQKINQGRHIFRKTITTNQKTPPFGSAKPTQIGITMGCLRK